MKIPHDQNFKNLFVDYRRAAVEFFAGKEAANLPANATFVPIRQEQLQHRLGGKFKILDIPILVKCPNREREALLLFSKRIQTLRAITRAPGGVLHRSIGTIQNKASRPGGHSSVSKEAVA